jgi:hypothetical protein
VLYEGRSGLPRGGKSESKVLRRGMLMKLDKKIKRLFPFAAAVMLTKEVVKDGIRHLRLRTTGVLAVAVVGFSSPSAAGIITVPSGLAPGSQYRLVFVTADVYPAISTNIGSYNTWVNSEANSIAALAALGTTWQAIGSTATFNAIDNIGIDLGVPIYDFLGNQIASDASAGAGGLFTPSGLFHSFNTDEHGNPDLSSRPDVWTGTGFDGTSLSGLAPLGNPTQTIWRASGLKGSDWLFFSIAS